MPGERLVKKTTLTKKKGKTYRTRVRKKKKPRTCCVRTAGGRGYGPAISKKGIERILRKRETIRINQPRAGHGKKRKTVMQKRKKEVVCGSTGVGTEKGPEKR